MYRKIATINLLVLVMAGLIFTGCGPKQRAAEGLLDTPESHYNQGMRKFEQGNMDAAQAQFEDALYLDKKHAPAHAGLALVSITRAMDIHDPKSKERKELVKQGDEHLDQAKDLDNKDVIVWIAHIRYHSIKKKGDDWIKDCEKGLKKALKINPESDEAYYYMGIAYKEAYDFRQSEDMLRNALEIDGMYSEKAGLAMQLVHKIVEAQPGTKYGKIIALVDEINRADLAVLFIEELNVVERIKRRKSAKSTPDLSFQAAEDPLKFGVGEEGQEGTEILDIESHWAQSMIRDFVEVGLFDVMQDHKFYPDEAVTRIEFAGTVQRLIYMVTQDEAIFSKYIGEKESHIRDMRTDHPYYGAAMLSVERDIMDLDKITGYFHPNDHVGGADALLFIRDIKNALKW
ncbi:hypothetical protein CEE37_03410 [candidate division LCP-89 bacterium B3_LCP]|uniref:SLH domain-containing protein n=1 Tax=candidate division LCP-89 bacterium B3_LCP TaxID=2012998 RepID=A0A532V3Q7_UNCL8|nr:MAG: hypothetical protein CEE37_03410 [candidate division LCP-89 bacterium B3_LCP]